MQRPERMLMCDGVNPMLVDKYTQKSPPQSARKWVFNFSRSANSCVGNGQKEVMVVRVQRSELCHLLVREEPEWLASEVQEGI